MLKRKGPDDPTPCASFAILVSVWKQLPERLCSVYPPTSTGQHRLVDCCPELALGIQDGSLLSLNRQYFIDRSQVVDQQAGLDILAGYAVRGHW